MITAYFNIFYPIILKKYVKRELKKYFGKNEIKNIIKKTNLGYKTMMENTKGIKVDKQIFEKLCINTYFINLYINIENEISQLAFITIQENVIKNCKLLKYKIAM
jgi:hypothetical protein